jgi:hypothetical protein
MENVYLDDVVVERAMAVARGEHRVVAGSDDEPLILASESPVRFAMVTFSLADSNLAFQSSFPVFLSNAVSWLAGTDVLASSLETVAVPVASAVVRNVEGQEVPARASGSRTSFSPEAPGLYSVRAGEREVVVSANLLNPSISAVNASGLSPELVREGQEERASGDGGGGELWIGLVLFALALILVEWWTYNRRLTV